MSLLRRSIIAIKNKDNSPRKASIGENCFCNKWLPVTNSRKNLFDNVCRFGAPVYIHNFYSIDHAIFPLSSCETSLFGVKSEYISLPLTYKYLRLVICTNVFTRKCFMKCFNTVILEISINNALKKYVEGFWNNMLSPNFHRIFHLNSFVLLIAGIYKPTSSHYQKSHLEVYVINTIWKAQKDQENFIFPSTFWLNKNRISHHRKVQNKKFSVTSKYHLSINFFTQKNPPYFPSPKSSKQELFSNQ